MYKSNTFVGVLVISLACVGNPSPAVPVPLGNEFVRQFESDGASLEMIDSEFIAVVRDETATAMSRNERSARAREMATWLWARHGRSANVRDVVVRFITPGQNATTLSEHRFSSAELSSG